MTKMRSTYLGNLRTEIEHIQSGNKVITDAPLDNKGRGEFFSPTDMLASALASCLLTTLGISANSYGFNIDGARIEIEKIMASNPRRVAEIILDFYLPKGVKYNDQAKRLIESTINTCPVSRSLNPEVIKTIRFHYDEK